MSIIMKLLSVFFQIGFFSIGGGYAIIPLIQEQVVNKWEWIDQNVFTNIITISQMTPGPIAVNTSTFVGLQVAGIKGAVAATMGCVISGIVISLLLYWFFRKNNGSVYVMQALNGLKSASLGLILSAAVGILLLTFCGTSSFGEIKGVDWIAVLIFGGTFAVLRKYKWSPILLMIGTGILGYFIY